MFEAKPNIFSYIFCAALVTLVGAAPCRAAPPPPPAAWNGVAGPAFVAPGDQFRVRARLTNTGDRIWEARGAGRVVVAAMIVDANGNPWPQADMRAQLAYPVPAGAATTAVITVRAPSAPGRYVALLGRGMVEKGTVLHDAGSPARWTFEVRK
jgi:hypothetical protein